MEHRTLRRPDRGATPEELATYRHDLARALEELGIRHGQSFVISPEASGQDSLLDTPKARSSDPKTSKTAALRNKPKRESQRGRILDMLVEERSRYVFFAGMTASVIAEKLTIPLNSISTRMSELERGGWVEPAGTTVEAGSERTLYVPTDRALA
jgi:hypothetical protein